MNFGIDTINQEELMTETTKATPPNTIVIKNVRLAFPDLREAVQFEGKGPASFKATFLVTPGSDSDTLIQATILKVAQAEWKDKYAPILAQIKASGSQKFCYVDGNTKAYDGYAGNMALSASRRQEDGAPKLIDQLMNELAADSGKPYGGCVVNAKVQFWAQDNQFGKGIRATLVVVQFVRDGAAFSGSGPANTDGMEPVEVEDSLV